MTGHYKGRYLGEERWHSLQGGSTLPRDNDAARLAGHFQGRFSNLGSVFERRSANGTISPPSIEQPIPVIYRSMIKKHTAAPPKINEKLDMQCNFIPGPHT